MTNVSSGEVKRFEHVQPMKWCQANVPDALTDGCDQLDNSHLPVTSGTVGTSAALSDSRNRFLLDYTMVSAFSIKGSIKLKNFQTVLLLNNVNPDGTPKPILNIVL
jgi:predicted AAA+ superfamily ATPase